MIFKALKVAFNFSCLWICSILMKTIHSASISQCNITSIIDRNAARNSNFNTTRQSYDVHDPSKIRYLEGDICQECLSPCRAVRYLRDFEVYLIKNTDHSNYLVECCFPVRFMVKRMNDLRIICYDDSDICFLRNDGNKIYYFNDLYIDQYFEDYMIRKEYKGFWKVKDSKNGIISEWKLSEFGEYHKTFLAPKRIKIDQKSDRKYPAGTQVRTSMYSAYQFISCSDYNPSLKIRLSTGERVYFSRKFSMYFMFSSNHEFMDSISVDELDKLMDPDTPYIKPKKVQECVLM